jgi:hypothetical protein
MAISFGDSCAICRDQHQVSAPVLFPTRFSKPSRKGRSAIAVNRPAPRQTTFESWVKPFNPYSHEATLSRHAVGMAVFRGIVAASAIGCSGASMQARRRRRENIRYCDHALQMRHQHAVGAGRKASPRRGPHFRNARALKVDAATPTLGCPAGRARDVRSAIALQDRAAFRSYARPADGSLRAANQRYSMRQDAGIQYLSAPSAPASLPTQYRREEACASS